MLKCGRSFYLRTGSKVLNLTLDVQGRKANFGSPGIGGGRFISSEVGFGLLDFAATHAGYCGHCEYFMWLRNK
jgi:hypothetical protein